jgi:hypothetical protein
MDIKMFNEKNFKTLYESIFDKKLKIFAYLLYKKTKKDNCVEFNVIHDNLVSLYKYILTDESSVSNKRLNICERKDFAFLLNLHKNIEYVYFDEYLLFIEDFQNTSSSFSKEELLFMVTNDFDNLDEKSNNYEHSLIYEFSFIRNIRNHIYEKSLLELCKLSKNEIWKTNINLKTINELIRLSIYPDANFITKKFNDIDYSNLCKIIDLYPIDEILELVNHTNSDIRIRIYKKIGIYKSLDKMMCDPDRGVRGLAYYAMPIGYRVPNSSINDRSSYNLGYIIDKVSFDQVPMLLGHKKIQKNKYLMEKLQKRLNSGE